MRSYAKDKNSLGEQALMMDSLPREAIIEILSRLPVTLLLHIKLVCKAWYNIIQDPQFISSHFLRIPEIDPCLLVHSDSPIQNQLYSLDLSPTHQTVNKIRVPALPHFIVVGSCKGLLLCLADSFQGESVLYVYNPFSRDYLELPEFSPKRLNQSIIFGFGFDQRTYEYKVIMVAYWKDSEVGSRLYYGGVFTTQIEVKVLTLGVTSWKSYGGVLSHRLVQTPTQVFLGGRIHWSIWPQPDGTGSSIVSFDMEDNDFREVPLPDWDSMNRFNYHLVDLGGCLSAAVYDMFGKFEIWVMKEYGVKESWTKEFKIGFHVPRWIDEAESNPVEQFQDSKWYARRRLDRILGLLKTGEILIEYGCRSLVTYDPRNETFKDLILPGLPNWFETVVHDGSLKWFDAHLNESN